ncbi:MAG: PD40 domain-containing protein [Bacteroidetes bacterium]|nr:PD40 domain-containing protein [Bacteroidota bacterium]
MAPISFDEEELVSQSKLLPSPVNYDVVFASRKIRKLGADNLDSMPSMPGVGSHSRFRASNPGSLIIYRKNGTLKTLINGSSPTLASLNLIDVNAPDVSYDGTKIVFAGLSKAPQGQIRDTMPNKVQGAWRIYVINVNGTGLTQLTNDNLVINSAQFNPQGYSYNNFSLYDDIDPIWLPDGRICFSSTRHPSNGEYFASRTTNLFVMNANGTNLHRITSERNGAERPVVDPQTGRIVYSRWWRTGRFPLNDTTTLANQAGDGFIRKKD